MAPILKWAGGKRSLIYEITALFPSDYHARAFHEPFFGGGAVFFKINPKLGTINDVNKRLMNFYTVVRDSPEQLIETASRYQHEKKTFYKLRRRYNQPGLSDMEYASLLLYLNKTAYNGLYRVNSNGKFNVPFGSYKNPTIVDEKRIMQASEQLHNIKIFYQDFEYILDYANQGDLVYFDPPYQPLNSTSKFTSYSSNGFTFQDQKRLRNVCKQLNENGVYFVLSNSFVPKMIELYSDTPSLRIEIVQAKRVISSKASTRGGIFEILVTNVPAEMAKSDIVMQYRFKRFKKESRLERILERPIPD